MVHFVNIIRAIGKLIVAIPTISESNVLFYAGYRNVVNILKMLQLQQKIQTKFGKHGELGANVPKLVAVENDLGNVLAKHLFITRALTMVDLKADCVINNYVQLKQCPKQFQRQRNAPMMSIVMGFLLTFVLIRRSHACVPYYVIHASPIGTSGKSGQLVAPRVAEQAHRAESEPVFKFARKSKNAAEQAKSFANVLILMFATMIGRAGLTAQARAEMVQCPVNAFALSPMIVNGPRRNPVNVLRHVLVNGWNGMNGVIALLHAGMAQFRDHERVRKDLFAMGKIQKAVNVSSPIV